MPSFRIVSGAALLAAALSATAAQAQGEARWYTPSDVRHFGLAIDGGVPSGAGLSFLARPYKAIRLHGGLAWDYVGFGVRGGATYVPFEWAVTPTLGVDFGHFFDGDASSFTSDPAAKLLLKKISYNYESILLGLEFGSQQRFTFFIKGGVTWLQTQGHNVQQAIAAKNTGGQTTILSAGDVKLNARAPTIALGVNLFLF